VNQIDTLPPHYDPEHTEGMDAYSDYFDRGSSPKIPTVSAPASPSASSLIEARHCKELIKKLTRSANAFGKLFSVCVTTMFEVDLRISKKSHVSWFNMVRPSKLLHLTGAQ